MYSAPGDRAVPLFGTDGSAERSYRWVDAHDFPTPVLE